MIRRRRRPFCSAVVVAAGSSQRMGQDKMFARLCGIPVLARTLRAINNCQCIDEIVVVAGQEKIVDVAQLCRDYGITKATKVICGGQTRAESSLAGICEISRKAKLVAIHDGARPLVTEDVVYGAVHAAAMHKCAAPGIPVKDTVKIAEDGTVIETPQRSSTVAIQTPQVFVPELIDGAITYALENELEITDDCSAAELLGIPVHITEGSEENIKLTTPLDMALAETILRNRGDGQCE